MSRQNNISYQEVSSFCTECLASGQRPSIRKIHQHLGGGSFLTITAFYQQWQKEQALASKVDSELSEPLRQALFAEFGRVTQKIKEDLEAQLEELHAQGKEAQEIIADYEAKMEQSTADFLRYKEQSEVQCLKLERELSAIQARFEESAKREAACTEQLETLRTQCHSSELRAAALEAKLAEIEKYNHRLELELQTLKQRSEAQPRKGIQA